MPRAVKSRQPGRDGGATGRVGDEHANLPAIVGEIDDPSPAGVAAAINRLIRSGALAAGDRLPTVRQLASALGISPTTVNDAWKALAAVGAINPRGRAGTFVTDAAQRVRQTRFAGTVAVADVDGIDLSTGTPDPALLPTLRQALSHVTRRKGPLTTSYLDDPVLPELEALLRKTWPFEPERLTVVDGALDALDRLVSEIVAMGDRVGVEDPGFPPLLDMLEHAGAQILPLELDDEGVVPASLASVLASDPVAVFIQPRAQNPTGTSMSKRRAQRLARLLKGKRALVIEDDHSGDIASADDISLGEHLPERVVHIRSYSKSHGPDLRIAAVGGAADVVDALIARRMLGPAWTSRLLQAVLVELLTDPMCAERVSNARAAYAERAESFRAALAAHGLACTSGDGINVWVDVPDERMALLALAAQGIKVAPGSPFTVSGDDVDHLRVTTGLLDTSDPDQIEHVAAAIALATRMSTGQRGV